MTVDFSPLKGHEAIERAAANQGGGKFSPFAPRITWTEDQEEKHVLFLSPISECYTVDLHEFIEIGEGESRNGKKYTKFASFVSRKSLGEPSDDIEDRLDRSPRRRTLGVGVELEPTYETIKGRRKPTGLTVKTQTFTRSTDDGDVDVEAPVLGMIIQAQKNFYGWLNSYDRTQGPVHEMPFQIIRRGTDQDTSYDFFNVDVPVDLTPLFDNLENAAYIRDDIEHINELIGAEEDQLTAASIVGIEFLNKRFAELADDERYHEIIDPIDELPPSKFGKKQAPKRGARGPRQSPRTVRETPRAKTPEDAEKFRELREHVGVD